jgi:RsiW-degrading membrane proteinase PrsW (M82 family)
MSAPASPMMNAPRTSLPRWGVQASIIQPSKPAFWLFAILLAIGGYLFIDEESILSQLPTALAVSWGLVLLYAIPVFLLVYRLDLFEREPRLMLVAALLWGGVIATSLAGYANDAWLSVLGKVAPADFVSDWGAAVVAPVTEETLKLTGVIVLFLIASTEFDGVMDGFVYGALIGLGFTVTEDVSYFIRATAAFGGADQTGPVIDTFLIRVVAGGLYSHVLFAGLTGMGFAYFVTRTSETMSKRLLVFAALVAAGAGAHFVWDSPWMISILDTASATDKPSTVQWIEYGAVKGLPFLILLVLMVLFATRSESSTFRAIVAGEPDPEVMHEPEIVSLGSLWSRYGARSAARRARGPQGGALTGQLQSAQIEYGMIRSRATSLADPELVAQREKIRQIRAQIAALPLIAPPVVTAPVSAPATMPPAAPVAAAAVAPAPAVAPAIATTPAQAVTPAMATTATQAVTPAEAPAVAAAPAEAPAPKGRAKAAEPTEAAEAAEAAEQAAAAPAVEAAAQPQPVAQPVAAPAPPPPAPTWVPTHLVPPGGMQAWHAPDPSQPPMVNLPERLELVVENWAGAWALVRAVNGWRGWVDGRRLVERR